MASISSSWDVEPESEEISESEVSPVDGGTMVVPVSESLSVEGAVLIVPVSLFTGEGFVETVESESFVEVLVFVEAVSFPVVDPFVEAFWLVLETGASLFIWETEFEFFVQPTNESATSDKSNRFLFFIMIPP